MKIYKNFYLLIFIFFSIFIEFSVIGEGFTADWVNIVRLNNGRYRVIIKYTNLKIGEYREAHVDFTSKKEAISTFQKLARGAEFYWSSSKYILFNDKPEKNTPY